MGSVLILGGDSWANRGDEAILAGTLEGLRQVAPGVVPLVASDQPSVTAARHDAVVINRRDPRALLAAMRAADLVLWGGGQLLQNLSSRPFLWFQLALLELAASAGTPAAGFAQGVGPVLGEFDRTLAARTLRRLPHFSVRDAPSAAILETLGIYSDPIQLAADPALLMTPATPDRAMRILKGHGLTAPFVVVALRRWGHYRSGLLPVRWSRRLPASPDGAARESFFIAEVAEALDQFARAVGSSLLFVSMCPGGDQDDDALANAVRGRMRAGHRAALLSAELTAAEIAAVLGASEMVVGVRMHPLLFAVNQGVPVASISYLEKGRALLERLGLGDFVLDIEDVTREQVNHLMMRAWEARHVTRERLKRVMPDMRAATVDGLRQALQYGRRGSLSADVHPASLNAELGH